jgi:putative spermidine/putrescine transport system substrate-binding protein/spermidine/putrescine transport system substrate-binding protein
VISALLLVGGAALAGCGSGGGSTGANGFPSSPSASNDKGPLKILEWEGYEAKKFHPSFAKDYASVGLKYQYASASTQFLSKVQTGGAQVDIAHPCGNDVNDWVKAGLVAPIDVSKLSNWNSVNKQQANLGKFNGKYYYVPWDWGYESLIVNTAKVPGGTGPQSWADLWNPQYKNQISMEDFGAGAVKFTAEAMGLPYPNLNQSQLDQVKKKLAALGPNIRTLWTNSTDLVQQMTSGDVTIGYGWNDQYAKIKSAGTPVTYVNPKEGRNGWSCGYVVLKTTKHYNLALKFLDSAISKESCVAAINDFSLGCSNEAAVAAADPKQVKALQLNSKNIIATTHFDAALTPAQKTAFNQIWTEVSAGYGG